MKRLVGLMSDASALAAPFWKSEERRPALVLLGVVVALNLALVALAVTFTYWQNAFYNALEARDWNAFIALLLWWHRTGTGTWMPGFALLSVVFVLLTVYALYLRQALQIRWRRWMTARLSEDWLSARAYYRMSLTDQATDNPDQRIAEDVRLFVDHSLELSLGLMRSLTSVVSFVVVLWSLSGTIVVLGVSVPGYLVWCAVLYAAFGTGVSHAVGRRLVALNYRKQQVEADFRFDLIRILQNAEGVAFYDGEAEEKRNVARRFAHIVGNWRSIMTVTKNLTFFTSGFAQVALVFPFAVVAPGYFSGRISLGGVFQTSSAFVQVQTALSWFVENYQALTEWSATVARLRGFSFSLAKQSSGGGPVVAEDAGNRLELRDVTLHLPSGASLLDNADLRIEAGERVLLTGPSGTGKSTLLRAIIGIWPFGFGSIARPSASRMFFSQRPYMPAGSLKRILCYPRSAEEFSDQEVTETLRAVGLGHLAGSLDGVDVWDRRLSGGEQQKVALARALLIRPDWLFMDEATSNLDADAEDQFYRCLLQALPDSTFVSVGHRGELRRYHDRVLRVNAQLLSEEA